MSEGNKKQPSAKTKQNQEIRRKAMRNRMIALAVVALLAIGAVVFFVCKLLGVFEDRAEVSTLTLQEDGTVVCEEVTSFEGYDKKELKAFVKEEIAAYNKEAGGEKVKLNSLKVSDGQAYAKTTYASVEDYSAFTGIEMYAGTVKKAKKTYDFTDAFVSVKEGVKGSSVDALDVASQGKNKVVVIKENIQVVVAGEIAYVSDGATTMVDEHTVSIAQADGNEDATQLTYIIYK